MLFQRNPDLFSFEVNFLVLLIHQKILGYLLLLLLLILLLQSDATEEPDASFTVKKAQKTTSAVMRLLVQ